MSALPKRESVRRLIELVPEQDLDTVEKMLRGLVRVEDPVLAAFDSAPEDDEGELSDELVARLTEADRAIAEGRVVSHEEARRRLGL
ncbi:MAG: hypothetical protein ACYC5O_01420 [Anaerolineae bacterium]